MLEWPDGCLPIPPKKKLRVGYYLRIPLKLSVPGGYLQGEAAAINTPMPPPGSLCVSTLLGFLDTSQMKRNSWGSSNFTSHHRILFHQLVFQSIQLLLWVCWHVKNSAPFSVATVSLCIPQMCCLHLGGH